MHSYYVDQNMNTNKLQIASDFISLRTPQPFFLKHFSNYLLNLVAGTV